MSLRVVRLSGGREWVGGGDWSRDVGDRRRRWTRGRSCQLRGCMGWAATRRGGTSTAGGPCHASGLLDVAASLRGLRVHPPPCVAPAGAPAAAVGWRYHAPRPYKRPVDMHDGGGTTASPIGVDVGHPAARGSSRLASPSAPPDGAAAHPASGRRDATGRGSAPSSGERCWGRPTGAFARASRDEGLPPRKGSVPPPLLHPFGPSPPSVLHRPLLSPQASPHRAFQIVLGHKAPAHTPKKRGRGGVGGWAPPTPTTREVFLGSHPS